MLCYVVGGAIEELCGGFLGSVKLRQIAQKELEASSFYNQTCIRLFTSKEQAEAYALTLRSHSRFPKTPISYSTVNPVFTVDTHLDFSNAPLCTSVARQRSGQEITLNYYDINPGIIPKESIISADFVDSQLPSIIFDHEHRKGCVIS